MMSSEEETEFGLYTDKLLKKTKRTRQRVDAGEPRNSYSSIPNFSSRPSFLSGGNQNIYSAIFTQQQHFGLFGPGFGPSKMLNELLSTTRQKQAIDGGATAAALPTGGADSDADSVKYAASDCNTRCGSDQSSPPPTTNLAATVAAVGVRDNAELAHHMLRDILQGRKHDLMADHTQLNGQENGIIALNNNQLVNNNNIIESKTQQENKVNNSDRSVNSVQENGDRENSRGAINDNEAAQAMQECLAEAGVGDRQQAELMEEALTGMETDSLPSPKVEPSSPAKPEDAKKARVENIVSGMRSSPAPQQVNGCKKRKLYQPQQHDSTADRYIDPEEDDLEPEPVRQKRIEKDALKNQLRTMQEQLAEMQQKYVQLCTRMEQESDCQDVEEISSDTEDIKRSPVSSPSTREPPSSVGSTNNQQPVSLTQQVSKLKIGPPHIPPHFNGMIHPDHHHHPHMTNAAAMYFGVSHKLLLEQEARIKEAAVAAAVAESQQQQKQQEEQQRQAAQQAREQQQNCILKPDTITERLNIIRNMTPTGSELEGLADALKSEITASLSNIIDSIVTRFVHQRRLKQSEASAAAEQLNKDLMMASQMLDRKSPRTKVAERPSQPQQNGPMMNGNAGNYPQMMPVHIQKQQDMHNRPPMFQAPKTPGMNNLPMYGMGQQHNFCVPDRERDQEQNEALSLVVTPKKKRHKVTDTRITPRTVSRILAQDGMGMSPAGMEQNSCPSPRPYHQGPPPPPPPMLPVSLPTSVAIPNPGLHESQVFSPYSNPFFHGPSHGHHHIPMQASSSPPGMNKLERDSPPLPPHPPTLLHPALLAAAQHGGSPTDYHLARHGHPQAASLAAAAAAAAGIVASGDSVDKSSDCNSGDIGYDGIQPTISFSYNNFDALQSSTLTPMHLRKAKLMFFWVRYPSSAVLKMYFPDIKFNKNNTAQLVKWFSNFREFYYIQMEKYARQAVSEGVKNSDDIHVSGDSEIYRVLNLHYNRNNHIEVPSNFRFVVEQTLREFFKAIQGGKDTEQSWKKSIYKIISRLDDPVPEYFKSPNFLEQLE